MTRINEYDIFLYTQNPCCGKAIACLAFTLVDVDGKVIECEEKSETAFELENELVVTLKDIKEATLTEDITENVTRKQDSITVEFRIWKQGKVNMETLSSKLGLAIKHTLWELVLEKNLLPFPVFVPNTG